VGPTFFKSNELFAGLKHVGYRGLFRAFRIIWHVSLRKGKVEDPGPNQVPHHEDLSCT